MRRKFFLLIISLFISRQVSAGEVVQVKNTKALLSISPGELKIGDEVYIVRPDGKKTGILKITAIRTNQAIGEVQRGIAESGSQLRIKLPPPQTSVARAPTTIGTEDQTSSVSPSVGQPPFRFMKPGKSAAGIIGGISQDSLRVKSTNSTEGTSETLSLSGSSLSLLGYLELSPSKHFTTRFLGGLEQFQGKGTVIDPTYCSNSNSCSFGFTYLSFEASAQFNIFQNPTNQSRAWIGAGGEFLLSVMKQNSITALNTTAMTNYFLFVSAGYDYSLSKDTYVPLAFDYGFQMGNDKAAAGTMILRAGYGWRY